MRIIGGKFKGKSIEFLKSKNTRPLKDSVKENIFNVLSHSKLFETKINNSNILDLYSGIGSFGMECISRGAERVTFVEKDLNAAKILRNNLMNLSIINKSKVYNGRIEDILNILDEKFNIFFFDPPFKDHDYLQNIELIKKRKIFKKNHIVIVHRENKNNDKLHDAIKVIETKKYGRSKILFGFFN